jgi:hypothetical protein
VRPDRRHTRRVHKPAGLGARRADTLAGLSRELLDAQLDTIVLALTLVDDPAWRVHLDYLKDLRRVGEELLTDEPDPRPCRLGL